MDTLDLMRTFVAVADTQSFTGAGRRLGRSKALISKHVGELEERLGVRLINRTTRTVQVTEIGRAYYDRVRTLISDLEALEEAIKSESGIPKGRIKITAPQTLGEMELMEMLNAFRLRHPGLEVDVSPRRTGGLLLRGQLCPRVVDDAGVFIHDRSRLRREWRRRSGRALVPP